MQWKCSKSLVWAHKGKPVSRRLCGSLWFLSLSWLVSPNFSAAERRAAKKVVQDHNRQPATGAAKLQITVWVHKGKPSALQPSHKSVLVLTKLFCAATSLVNVVTPTLQTLSLAEPKEVVKNRDGRQHLTGPAVLPMTCLGAQRQFKCHPAVTHICGSLRESRCFDSSHWLVFSPLCS